MIKNENGLLKATPLWCCKNNQIVMMGFAHIIYLESEKNCNLAKYPDFLKVSEIVKNRIAIYQLVRIPEVLVLGTLTIENKFCSGFPQDFWRRRNTFLNPEIKAGFNNSSKKADNENSTTFIGSKHATRLFLIVYWCKMYVSLSFIPMIFSQCLYVCIINNWRTWTKFCCILFFKAIHLKNAH